MEFFDNPNLPELPANDEFELMVFGPGCGECLVLHCGNQEWCVIDSCRYPKQAEPIALQYLRKLGLDPAIAVKSILVTHWHDDHIGGMATLIRHCSSSRFMMSSALNCDQFFQLVLEVSAANKLVEAPSSATEFEEILEILESRSQQPPHAVEDGCIVYQNPFFNYTTIQALSPSPNTVRSMKADIASKILVGSEIRKFAKIGTNELSVAVQVVTPTRRLLLKADLENSNDPLRGWQAVLSSTLPRHKDNSIVKVGHHGSSNADYNHVWSQIVSNDPIKIVTPYSRLADPLPRDADINRIVSRGGKLYCTSWPVSRRPDRRPQVDKLMNSVGINRKAAPRAPGAVRVRFSMTDGSRIPDVKLFGSATRL